ncbi:unnamed protein product [Urochloa humidicola]
MGKQVISYAGDKVKLTIISKSPKIPTGQQGDMLPMLVRVEAPTTTKKHVPVDLVALLDVSSSMSNEVAPGTTRLDLLKKAMKFVIKQLHGDDGLAIVPFNEKIRTGYATELFRISSQRFAAQNKVNNLVTKGDTEFGPALELAVKTLDERSDKNRVGVIMLLTDGMDSRKSVLYPIRQDLLNRYPIHTFGICVHDPNLLLSFAQQSLGTYSFVDDKELGKIADPFAVFIGGLRSIVAVDVLVKLSCYTGWRSAVKQIDCGFQSSEITQPPATNNGWSVADIRIGMLYAGEVKNFIANVVVDPDTSGTRQWGQTYFTYKDAPGSSLIYGEGHNLYLYTGNQAGDPLKNSRMVREQLVQFTVLDFVSTLEKEFRELKNTACAKALSKANAAQVQAGSTLETRWEEFIDTIDDDLIDDLDLEDLKEEVQEMVSRLKGGAGMAYMCAWLSSQQMQRATTPGSVDAVGAQFFTPAMDTMLSASKKYHVQLQADEGASKLEQRKAEWENLKSKVRQLLNQPMDTALAQTFKDLEVAINKAKDDDITEATKRGET